MSETTNATLLNAATATGLGNPVIFQSARANHSIQVVLTGAPTAVKVALQGSIDGVTFNDIATWDTANGQVTGDILSVNGVNVVAVQANFATLTGGTVPTVSVFYSGKST